MGGPAFQFICQDLNGNTPLLTACGGSHGKNRNDGARAPGRSRHLGAPSLGWQGVFPSAKMGGPKKHGFYPRKSELKCEKHLELGKIWGEWVWYMFLFQNWILSLKTLAAKVGFTCSKSNMDIKHPNSWREHPRTKPLLLGSMWVFFWGV